MLIRKTLALVAAGALSALATTSAYAQSWDMPTPYAPSNFHTVNIDHFTAAVKQATGGKLVITVHPGASLYKMPEIKRAVQTRQVPIGEVLMVTLVNDNPLYAVDGLPFLANSYAEARKLWTVQRPYIESVLDAQGLKLLFAVPWPPQGLMTAKEIKSVADLEGLNFRAYDKQTSRLGELIKARPVTIQAAEVAQALATGKINALTSSAQSGVDYKAWESLKYFYDVQAWLPKNMVIVNAAAFNALDKGTQDILLAEAKKAEEAGWKSSREVAEATKKTLAENGMKVLPPSPQLVADFNRIGKQMVDEWLAGAGPDGKAIVDAYRK
ncbi:MAG: TRAP transporter substrate-binding protein [Burkholderiales bacterium]